MNLTEEHDKSNKSDCFWQSLACKKDLLELKSQDAMNAFHFDIQQTLPTPKLPVGKQVAMDILIWNIFCIHQDNYSIHVICVRRGCNDIILHLFRFIFYILHRYKGVSGGEASQNKNNYIMWLFKK